MAATVTDFPSTVSDVQAAFGVYAPYAMLGAGIALLMVPRWLRASIAVTLIAFGLVGIWPELLEGRASIRP